MLADVNEPIILADGTKINPANGSVIREKKYTTDLVEIPSPREAQEIVARTRRSVADMPVPPAQMNGISLVLFYTTWGLADQDISVQLGISIPQIKNIKKLPEYKQLQGDLFKNIMETEATEVRGFFQQHARGAAKKIVDLIEEDGVLAFKAAQDVLDRAGHRPADIVEHRHTLENTLQIEVIRKDQAVNAVPVIDAEFEEVN
jgi:hypothetical protein